MAMGLGPGMMPVSLVVIRVVVEEADPSSRKHAATLIPGGWQECVLGLRVDPSIRETEWRGLP